MTLLIAVHFGVAAFSPLLVRWLRLRAFWVLAVPPVVTLVWLLSHLPIITSPAGFTENWTWIGSLDVQLSVRIGTLQLILALLVSGVGALVLLYCRWYFGDGEPNARTGGLLLAFAGAMLGLVTADDVIMLYVYWELTTVFSYLLVGHNPTRSANRGAALTALMVTTFGGLAMLTGLIILGVRADTFSLSTILADPQVARSGAVGAIAVVLVLVGAVTKSALVPFHFWLPGAMAAPTPVSAYLHAAAMVKAGVYLVALLAPAFAATPGWRPVVLTLGAMTMIIGGWRALRQHDLKLLLAFGTVSQLGFLILLTGIGTRAAMQAGVAMIISHALFKATLFMVVGIIDHQAGTRDLRKLSGVGRAALPVAVATVLAGASMAAVPPTIGFITKESAFESLIMIIAGDGAGAGAGAAVRPLPALLLIMVVIAGSILTVAYTLRFVWGALATKPGLESTPVRKASVGFWFAPVLLGVLGVIGGFLGYPLSNLLAPLVEQVPYGELGAKLALWHGLGAPLLLSGLVLVAGGILFWRRDDVRRSQNTFPSTQSAESIYQLIMRGLDRLAVEVTARTQRGSLPIYLGAILIVLIALPGGALMMIKQWPGTYQAWDTPSQAAVGAVMIIAAILAATSRGRLKAVMLVGVTGYGTALLFLLHGAPDLALTQVLVETVTVVVLVLVLRKLPKYFTDRPLHNARWWRLGIALASGLVICMLTLVAGGSRVAVPVSEAFSEAAYDFGYGKNIVNVTLVDIRAWDTMGEISVLVVAATGVASLIFLRRRYVDLTLTPERKVATPAREPRADALGHRVWLRGSQQLSPLRRSLVFEVVTRLLFPVMILCSLFALFAGHNGPGGGFAGGLIAGLALAIRYLAGGRYELDEAAPVDAGRLLGVGLMVSALSALAPPLFGGRILQSYAVDIVIPYLSAVRTPWGELAILGEVHLVTSLFFDIGVYLVVIGVMLDLVRSLGAGIDLHEIENETPTPKTPPSVRAAAGQDASSLGTGG